MWNTKPGHGRERNLGHHRRGKQRIDRGSRERNVREKGGRRMQVRRARGGGEKEKGEGTVT